jgi:hypothetical protein
MIPVTCPPSTFPPQLRRIFPLLALLPVNFDFVYRKSAVHGRRGKRDVPRRRPRPSNG